MERKTQRGGGIKTDVGGGTETLPKNGEEVACERDRREERWRQGFKSVTDQYTYEKILSVTGSHRKSL